MAFVDYSKIVPMHLVTFFVKLRATVSFPPLSRGLVLDARKIDFVPFAHPCPKYDGRNGKINS